jgi:SAM-dependent methyltransferase
MDSPWFNSKVIAAEPPSQASASPLFDVAGPAIQSISTHGNLNSVTLANQELIRSIESRHAATKLVAYTAAWYDELEQKRFQRHGNWLPAALEFGRHPGESLLLLGAGLGSDAIQYTRTGTPVTIGVGPHDHPQLLRENFDRQAIAPHMVDINGSVLPFADGTFDVVTWNALFDPTSLDPIRINELFRVLKAGGKVIGLFPAWYDAGFWQDVLLPLQWMYWRRPSDPTTAPKLSARQLRKAFMAFKNHRIAKRHLRRSELPHLWRILPLVLLERFIGRVLVFKALKLLTPLAA